MLDEAAREHGFGTGLLAHLERGRAPWDEAVDAPPPVEVPEPEPEQTPEPAADPLAERERRLAARESELEAALAELAARDEELRPAESPAPADLTVPEHLRARAEREAERVWAAFGEALEATHPDGRPDHALRVAAAQALLAELRLDPPGAAFADELARRRERRGASR